MAFPWPCPNTRIAPAGAKASVTYVEKHRKDVAAKIIADLRVDIDHLDDAQVLRLAQYMIGVPPLREPG